MWANHGIFGGSAVDMEINNSFDVTVEVSGLEVSSCHLPGRTKEYHDNRLSEKPMAGSNI